MESTHSEKDTKGVMHYFCQHHSLKPSVVKAKNKYKELLPLLYVFLVILALSSVRQIVSGTNPMMFMMDFMGIFFMVFGLLKLVDLKGFVDGFQSYDSIASRFRLYGYIYPFIEIALGGLYLLGIMFLWQNILVFVLASIGIYTAYKSINQESEIRCVCLGTLFDLPMTWVTFFENALMLLMVIFMIIM
jgi:hypothetical protein